MRKFGNGRKPNKSDMVKGESSRREKYLIINYECKKLGHIKFECPLLKKRNTKRSKKKAMVNTWNDSDFSDDDSYDEEVANLCHGS